jgi:EVE domain
MVQCPCPALLPYDTNSPTETAFDPAHPYYDPKSSRDNPKWDLVYVTFIRKFPELVKLSELRSFTKSGGALENMQILRQSRLSVSVVKPKEWAFILGLAGEEDQVEEEQDRADELVDEKESGGAEDIVDETAEDAVNGDKDGSNKDGSSMDGSSMVNELVDDEAAVDGDLDDNEGGDDADDETVGEMDEEVK